MRTPVAFCCHCSTGLLCPLCEDVWGREARLIQLLRKAQNRLRNQGDVAEITEQMNEEVHAAIERELSGKAKATTSDRT